VLAAERDEVVHARQLVAAALHDGLCVCVRARACVCVCVCVCVCRGGRSRHRQKNPLTRRNWPPCEKPTMLKPPSSSFIPASSSHTSTTCAFTLPARVEWRAWVTAWVTAQAAGVQRTSNSVACRLPHTRLPSPARLARCCPTPWPTFQWTLPTTPQRNHTHRRSWTTHPWPRLAPWRSSAQTPLARRRGAS
jgi:hypothetical protein